MIAYKKSFEYNHVLYFHMLQNGISFVIDSIYFKVMDAAEKFWRKNEVNLYIRAYPESFCYGNELFLNFFHHNHIQCVK